MESNSHKKRIDLVMQAGHLGFAVIQCNFKKVNSKPFYKCENKLRLV